MCYELILHKVPAGKVFPVSVCKINTNNFINQFKRNIFKSDKLRKVVKSDVVHARSQFFLLNLQK